jgi:hypothetical protein
MRIFYFFYLYLFQLNCFHKHLIPSAPSSSAVDSLEIDDALFEKVEVEATFSGGERAWRKYLEQNLNPNVPAENGAPVWHLYSHRSIYS